MPNVLIAMRDGEMPAYLATPPSNVRAPGVIVIHDAGGMTRDHRSRANEFRPSAVYISRSWVFRTAAYAERESIRVNLPRGVPLGLASFSEWARNTRRPAPRFPEPSSAVNVR
jgi:hypothetical protein